MHLLNRGRERASVGKRRAQGLTKYMLIVALALGGSTVTSLADHHDLEDACGNRDKTDLRLDASYAIYYSEQNFPIQIEDLAGEKHRRICQMDPAGSACPGGYCQILILGVNYCKRC